MSDTLTISVGKLRQNPTAELRHVREGAEYLITDHGVSIGRIVPVEQEHWMSAEEAATIFSVPTDPTWPAESRRDRDAITGQDPWEPR